MLNVELSDISDLTWKRDNTAGQKAVKSAPDRNSFFHKHEQGWRAGKQLPSALAFAEQLPESAPQLHAPPGTQQASMRLGVQHPVHPAGHQEGANNPVQGQ